MQFVFSEENIVKTFENMGSIKEKKNLISWLEWILNVRQDFLTIAKFLSIEFDVDTISINKYSARGKADFGYPSSYVLHH